MECCQHRGICTPLYLHMPLIHPYALHIPPVHLYVPLYHILPICHGNFGVIYTPHMSLGLLEGDKYICQTFLCLPVHPFASQFITVIPAAPHHCGLLLYWTGCLWMSVILHAVVPFFAVFSLCLKPLLHTAMTTTPLVAVVFWYIISPLNSYHGPLLDGASSNNWSA